MQVLFGNGDLSQVLPETPEAEERSSCLESSTDPAYAFNSPDVSEVNSHPVRFEDDLKERPSPAQCSRFATAPQLPSLEEATVGLSHPL